MTRPPRAVRLQRLSLRNRLLLSYFAVLVSALASVVIVGRIVAPPAVRTYFDDTNNHAPNAVVNGVIDALGRAILITVVVAALAAVLIAGLVARLMLRPLDEIRQATNNIARGHYDQTVAVPAQPELAALATDVNALADTLATTERRRARLVSEVAHELRTPLTTLQGQLEGIVEGLIAPNEEELASMADDIARLVHITTDLQSLSRAEENAYDLQFADVDLLASAQGVAHRLRPQFDDQHVALRTVGVTTLVRADPNRIAQLLTNLIGNALAATPSGGSVAIVVDADRELAAVTIRDTGRGLAGDDLERIFERFERVRSAGAVHAASGSGIGLTIARSIARAHHGTLTATSPGLGRGATFKFAMPAGDLGAQPRETR